MICDINKDLIFSVYYNIVPQNQGDIVYNVSVRFVFMYKRDMTTFTTNLVALLSLTIVYLTK